MPETTTVTTESASETAPATETSEATNTPVTRSALESRAESQLDALLGGEQAPTADDADESGTPADETPAAPTGEEQQVPAEGENEAEAAAKAVPPKPGEKPAAAKPDAPTLPAAYRRSLKAAEWSDEEIDASFQAQGPKFLEYATKIHQDRNKLTEQWAALGRAERQKQAANPGQQTELKPMQPLDPAAIKAKYGDDALIDFLVAPMNQQIQTLNGMMEKVQKVFQQAEATEIESLSRQVEGFFGSKEMEPYKELYGRLTDGLSQEQIEARNKVLELADAVMHGAKAQQRRLSFDEALKTAIDSQTGDYKKQAVRQELKEKLKQRTKGLTLKPTGKTGGVASTVKTGDRDALAKRAELGMAKVFN